MSDLSEDLVEEILSRVPAKSLKRLRSTCKQWNALFNDHRFTKKHFDNAPRESETLLSMDYRIYSVNVDLSLGFKDELSLNKSHYNLEQIKISKIFHCDGLLLCTTKGNRFVVWNPCNGQTRWIKPARKSHVDGWYALGYENNKSCRSDKLLRHWDNHNRMHQVVECEIYEFSSDSWRDILDGVNLNSYIRKVGVSLKGNTYLVAFAFDDAKGELLLSFDYSTERFRRMPLPFQRNYFDTLAVSVVKEEQHLVLHESNETTKLDIWVTNNDKIDQTKGLSWSKLLAVHLYNLCFRFSSYVSFFITEEKKVGVCCEVGASDGTSRNMIYIIGDDFLAKKTKKKQEIFFGDGHGYREIPIGEYQMKPHQASIINYVPSFLQIQGGTTVIS